MTTLPILSVAVDKDLTSYKRLSKFSQWNYPELAEFLKSNEHLYEICQRVKADEISGNNFLKIFETETFPLWYKSLDDSIRDLLSKLYKEIQYFLSNCNDFIINETIFPPSDTPSPVSVTFSPPEKKRRKRQSHGSSETSITLDNFFPKLNGETKNACTPSIKPLTETNDRKRRDLSNELTELCSLNEKKNLGKLLLSCSSGLNRRKFTLWVISCCNSLAKQSINYPFENNKTDCKIKQHELTNDLHNKLEISDNDTTDDTILIKHQTKQTQSHSVKRLVGLCQNRRNFQRRMHLRHNQQFISNFNSLKKIQYIEEPKKPEKLTFLIIPPEQTKPTRKILYALASKTFILTEAFLKVAKTTHKWPSPLLYEHPKWPKVLERSHPLFVQTNNDDSEMCIKNELNGMAITIIGVFSPPSLQTSDIQHLIRLCGAIYRPESLINHCDLVIVAEKLLPSQIRIIRTATQHTERQTRRLLKIVPLMWFIESISQWKIQQVNTMESLPQKSTIMDFNAYDTMILNSDIKNGGNTIQHKRESIQINEEELENAAPITNSLKTDCESLKVSSHINYKRVTPCNKKIKLDIKQNNHLNIENLHQDEVLDNDKFQFSDTNSELQYNELTDHDIWLDGPFTQDVTLAHINENNLTEKMNMTNAPPSLLNGTSLLDNNENILETNELKKEKVENVFQSLNITKNNIKTQRDENRIYCKTKQRTRKVSGILLRRRCQPSASQN